MTLRVEIAGGRPRAGWSHGTMDYGNVEQWLHHASGDSASVRAGAHSLRRAARLIAEAPPARMVRVMDGERFLGRMFFDQDAWRLYRGSQERES